MIKHLRRTALFGATALAALAVATPASAQRVDRIVAFGDSYADDDNLFQLLGINRLTTQIYTTGRFSGGTNYIDTLSFLLQVPQENFAIGGAQARNQNGQLPTFGLPYQVDQFLNVGEQSSVFPNSTPRFDRGDLVMVSIGGNDARQFQQITSAGGTPTFTVQDSIASARTQLDRLVNAGAPTISFLAGNTAQLPETDVVNNPAAQALRNTFSNTYNAALQSTLAGYAQRGVIVHYLDLSRVLDRVRTNGAAYGLPNGVVCPQTPANVLSGCAGYLFYVDNLHLSSDGFRVVGQYVQRQLQAPLSIGATSDLALDTARQFGRTLNSRMDLGSPRDGEVLEGIRFFVVGDQFSRDVDMSDVSDAFDLDSTGGTAGVEFGLGANGVVGVAGNYSRARAEFGAQPTRIEGDAIQIGAYASFGLGPIFVQAHAGAGRSEYDIARAGVIDSLTATPDGDHLVAGAKAGFLAPLGPVRFGPVASIDYARASVDGYTEEGDGALTINVGEQRFSALVGGIGVELRGDLDAEGTALRPFASAMLEKDLRGDGRTLTFAQTASPTIVNRFDVGERDTGVYTRFAGGASATLGSRIQLDVHASTTAGKDQGNEVSAQVGVRLGF
jgi:outer membrane autotransporter protein